jgi:hypothetical protein
VVHGKTRSVLLETSECTEVYYILQGQGKMEWNDDVIDVAPGVLIDIEPFTPHRLWSVEGVRTIVFGSPALKPTSMFFLELLASPKQQGRRKRRPCTWFLVCPASQLPPSSLNRPAKLSTSRPDGLVAE